MNAFVLRSCSHSLPDVSPTLLRFSPLRSEGVSDCFSLKYLLGGSCYFWFASLCAFLYVWLCFAVIELLGRLLHLSQQRGSQQPGSQQRGSQHRFSIQMQGDSLMRLIVDKGRYVDAPDRRRQLKDVALNARMRKTRWYHVDAKSWCNNANNFFPFLWNYDFQISFFQF